MSTTGHYTRYINQYPGWHDNCDTMAQTVHSGLLKICKFCDGEYCKRTEEYRQKYCQVQLGYFQVEHTAGNKRAWCSFSSFVYNENNVPGSEFWIDYVYEYEGKLAIQNVLEFMKTYPAKSLIGRIIKERFYNRSYCDYFSYYLEMTA